MTTEDADCFDVLQNKDHSINNTNQNDSFFSFPNNQINPKEDSSKLQENYIGTAYHTQNAQAIPTTDKT